MLIAMALIGPLLLMIWLEHFRSRIARDDAVAATGEHPRATTGARVFISPQPATPDVATVLRRLEDHVRHERHVVSEFLSGPTAWGLFPEADGRVDDLARRLEDRVRHEVEATNAFFADPSVDMLFRNLGHEAA